jgi:hypothetical protein
VNAFAALLAEPAPVQWHEDPRDKDPRPEDARQSAFLREARKLCPAVDIVAVPNSGNRGQKALNQRLREGMRPGALDLFATWPGGVAFLEFKDGSGAPDANQRDRLRLYLRQGHHCGVFRQEASAIAALRRWGAPFL